MSALARAPRSTSTAEIETWACIEGCADFVFLNIILIDVANIFFQKDGTSLYHLIGYESAHFLTPSLALDALHLPAGLPSRLPPSLLLTILTGDHSHFHLCCWLLVKWMFPLSLAL